MEKIKFNFSLTDFLAYLFPGIGGLLGLWIIMRAIPTMQAWMAHLKLDFTTGIVVIALAYCFGVLSSSVVSVLFSTDDNDKMMKVENPINNPLLLDFRDTLKDEFEKKFGCQEKWGKKQFYMIRAIIQQFSPEVVFIAERQNALRQLRRNIVLVTVIWAFALVLHSIKQLFEQISVSNSVGIVFSVLGIIIGVFFAVFGPKRLKSGMIRNRAFEVRDYSLHFILLSKRGCLKKLTEQKHTDRIHPPVVPPSG